MSREREDHGLSTADFAAAGQPRQDDAMLHAPEHRDDGRHVIDADRQDMREPTPMADTGQTMPRREHPAMAGEPMQEHLAPLFMAEAAQEFRNRWDAVQIGFVDDPRHAVQQADELVAQVMKSLAESFARQRAGIEADVDQTDQASTENLRVALRRYRSFFQRLLSL